MLVRNLQDDSYLFQKDRSVQQMMDYTYAQAITINQSFWSEADIDTRFKVGDQSLWEDYYGNLPAFRRKQFYFNRIRRVCNLITGYQRRNRKSTIASPVGHEDDKAASQWSKLLFHTLKQADADDMISEAFENGSVTTGMSLLNTWINYSQDPHSGDIRLDHVPYNSFLIDPYFRKKDLSDCNFIWRRQWLSKEAVKSLIPESEAGFVDSLSARGNRDGKFQFMAEAYNYGMQDLLSYDEYWYRAMREATFLYDPKFGMTKEWKGDKKNLDAYLARFPQLTTMKAMVPTVKLAVVVEGHTVYHGPNPLRIDKYPFIPFIGYYEPNLPYFPWRVQGVVRNLRDSQFLYNRRKVIELDILESQVNSGFKYKPTSLVNPRDIFLEGQGKGIPLKEEADMNDVQEIQPAQIPPSMLQLSELLGREIQEISGVNEELLGSADDDKAGILSMLRQGAGLTTLQVLFDQLDASQKLVGEITLDLIRENYSLGKIARILGEIPEDEFKEKLWLNYDVRIEEGVNTTTQRQMQFAQLLHLHEAGIPGLMPSIVRAATLQDKEEVIQSVQQQEQQQAQMQQMQLQTQMALVQAQTQNFQGQAVANYGLGKEREARIAENSELAIERRAKAIEDITDAQLNRAKVLSELQNIDLTQIQQLLTIAEMLKAQGQDEAAEAEAQASAPTTSTGQKLSLPTMSLNMGNVSP